MDKKLPTDWRNIVAPSLAEMEAIAEEAYARLPKQFQALCEGLVIHVDDFPSDEVPVEVQRACAELALKAATQPLAPDQGRETKREKVGEIEVEYMDRALPFVRYTAIDRMLAPFLSGFSGGAKVVRT